MCEPATCRTRHMLRSASRTGPRSTCRHRWPQARSPRSRARGLGTRSRTRGTKAVLDALRSCGRSHGARDGHTPRSRVHGKTVSCSPPRSCGGAHGDRGSSVGDGREVVPPVGRRHLRSLPLQPRSAPAFHTGRTNNRSSKVRDASDRSGARSKGQERRWPVKAVPGNRRPGKAVPGDKCPLSSPAPQQPHRSSPRRASHVPHPCRAP